MIRRGPRKNLLGQHFGRLVVVSMADADKKGYRWNCRCDCGVETTIAGVGLRQGTRSCGCLAKETAAVLIRQVPRPQLAQLVTHILTGRRFGRWLVLGLADHGKGRGLRWLCICDCGQVKIIGSQSLIRGESRSCGCYQRDTKRTHCLSPAHNRHPLYATWAAMWTRCRNAKHVAFHRYGGRGITVCDRWKDFAMFVQDIGPKPTPSHTLDRFPNPDGNYEPGNVRWATALEQANNRGTASVRRAA